MAPLDEAHLSIAHDGGVMHLSGEIDVAGGPVLDATIREHEGREPLVLDLGEVNFIDSSGLRILLAAARRAEVRGERVALVCVGAEVSRLLELTCTSELFDVSPR